MATPNHPLEAFEAAIRAAGGASALARALGLTPGVVTQWRKAGRVPAERVRAISQATGVPPEALRPDLYPAGAAQPGFAEVQLPLVQQAEALGLDAEAIAERALREAVGREKARRWAEENKAAIEAWTRYFEENDTPLAEFRQF
ncbi:YdaS family helix-turn-helix protein [Siccirubricoccus sp. KC 17139]|uniref:YdaS family helix-turn-helix protein n=1 Tax=Siccirubricoccus soli TaxID=2899147 RepID=A0ABT1DBM9_9PROT|nr:YdaS family helix-turn-helix protein [Siccirubricoccus soli]MCO6419343.1 YdaS family helix-turn-helix protein [Siccirubricoccus soli]MCP2685478.1 YdaS family helix-turn-helix protein [Siccirubricoccus soli]